MLNVDLDGVDLDSILRLPPDEQQELMRLLSMHREAKSLSDSRSKFHDYIERIWGTDEPFIDGRHIRHISKIVDRMMAGEGKKRIIINMPPRHMKSRMFSVMLPSYYLGQYPYRKVIQASNVSDLAIGFGRNVRDIIKSKTYQEIFPGVEIKADVNAAGRWNTNRAGEYYAVGAEGNVTGRGGHLIIIDDPHSDFQITNGFVNPKVFDSTFDWFSGTLRQRLMPGGFIIICQCIAEGQRVLMANGAWKEIENIKVGDSVIGYDEGKPVPKKVLATMPQGPDDVFKVTLRSTELRANARHPVLVMRGGLKKAAQNAEDVVQSRDWSLEWAQVGDLKVGDTVVTIKDMQKGNYHRPSAFGPVNRIMDQEDYWLLGFMWGDGWLVSHKNNPTVGYAIAKSNYPALNERVLKAAKKLFKKDLRETKYGYWVTSHKDGAVWLKKKGFCAGAKKKRLPEWVFRLRPCDKVAFIHGMLDADGCVRKRKGGAPADVQTYTLGIANKALLDDFRLLARTCGVKTSKIHEEHKMIQAPNSPEPIMSECYRAKFTDKRRRFELRGRYRQMGVFAEYFRLEDVEAITPDGRANVYDITVEGAESFIAEGVVVHNTRFSKRDLTGRIIEWAKQNGTLDEWEIVEFPAILPKSGKQLWPEFWPMSELEAAKRDMPPSKWSSQYLQQPSQDEGAIIKKDTWRPWPNEFEPDCDFIIQSWDTAFSAKETANYSACTTWGVFNRPNDRTGKSEKSVILLHAFRERLEFPALKKKAREFYLDHKPDTIIVEAKATGTPLIFELRQMNIPVSEYNPSRGSDKVTRVNSVSDLFQSGKVWYMPNVATETVIDEFTDFPSGAYDDLVDSSTQALMRFRQGLFIDTENDFYDDDEDGRVVRDNWGYY